MIFLTFLLTKPSSTDYKQRNHYRRYDNNLADDNHLCNSCAYLSTNKNDKNETKYFLPECGSSYFRHIDKQRIVYNCLNTIMDVSKIMEKLQRNEFMYRYLLLQIFLIHNYEAYDKDLSQPNIIKTYLTIKETTKVKKLNNRFRTFIGEEFGFYYFWITHLIGMLTIPTVVGLLIVLGIKFGENHYGDAFYDNNMDMYLMLPFSCLIIIWSRIYLMSWMSKEKFYKFTWGMNEFFLDVPSKQKPRGSKMKIFQNIKNT